MSPYLTLRLKAPEPAVPFPPGPFMTFTAPAPGFLSLMTPPIVRTPDPDVMMYVSVV